MWLNEGFATWAGWLATDHINPSWDVWTSFCNQELQNAFDADSLRSSHPIEVPVRDALEVDQIFDQISYLKGSSVIRMLASYLTVDTFVRGVSSYLKANAYGNATTKHLWNALSAASNKDVDSFMAIWIKKIGFPVVTVAEEPGQITVRQSRFLSGGNVTAEEDSTVWWIPLGLKTGSKVETASLSQKEDVIRDVDDDFYKINADHAAFFRTNLPPARLEKLGTQLDRLSVQDKVGMIADAAALAVSGMAATPALLAFMEHFSAEINNT